MKMLSHQPIHNKIQGHDHFDPWRMHHPLGWWTGFVVFLMLALFFLLCLTVYGLM